MFVPKLVTATGRAWRLLRRLRPSVVVNVGGYGSAPATIAAVLLRNPLVTVSYDRRPGLVTRLAARRARASACAFEGSELPRAVHTGAPVRPAVLAIDRVRDRSAARVELELPEDRFVVAVMSGSLGARAINEVVAALAERSTADDTLAIHHVVGARFLDEAAPSRLPQAGRGILYRVVGFEHRVPQLLAAADVVLARAGAGTLAELAAVGVPSILVPWDGAADDHQRQNARHLGERGAALVVDQRDLTVDRLAELISRLRDAPAELDAMADAAAAAGAIHRSGALVELIERIASGGRALARPGADGPAS